MLGRPPAEADLQRYFRVSPPSVHQMVLALERAGLIRRQAGAPRSIEVILSPEMLPALLDQPLQKPCAAVLGAVVSYCFCRCFSRHPRAGGDPCAHKYDGGL